MEENTIKKEDTANDVSRSKISIANICLNNNDTTSISATKSVGKDKVIIKNVYVAGHVAYACSSNNGLYVSKDNGHSWTNYNTTSGMLSNCVRDVFVDDKGFIYVATDKGVSISFNHCAIWYNKVVNSDSGQGGLHRISAGDGNIYAATTDNGLYILVFSTGGVMRHDKQSSYRDIANVSAVCASRNFWGQNPPTYYTLSGVRPVFISSSYINSDGAVEEVVKVSWDCGLTWSLMGITGPISAFSPIMLPDHGGAYYIFVTCKSSSDDHALRLILIDQFCSSQYFFKAPPSGVCSVACSGSIVYAAAVLTPETTDSSGETHPAIYGNTVYVGQVIDSDLLNISWKTYQIPLVGPNPLYAPTTIDAMAAVSSGEVAYAVTDRGDLYVTPDSGVSWTHVNNFDSSVSASTMKLETYKNKNIVDPQMKKEDIKNDFHRYWDQGITNIYINDTIDNNNNHVEKIYACSEENGFLVSNADGGNEWTKYLAATSDNKVGVGKDGILSNCVRDICAGNGSIYVATDKGVSIAAVENCEAKVDVTWSNVLCNSASGQNGVYRIAVSNKHIYAATTDNGLYILDLQGNLIKQEKPVADNDQMATEMACVTAVYVDTSSSADFMPVYIGATSAKTVDKMHRIMLSYSGGLKDKKWVDLEWPLSYVGPIDSFSSTMFSAVQAGEDGSDVSARKEKIIYAACSNSSDFPSNFHGLYATNGGLCTEITIENQLPANYKYNMPFGVSTIACGGSSINADSSNSGHTIYAGSSNDDGQFAIGKFDPITTAENPKHEGQFFTRLIWESHPLRATYPSRPDSKKIVAIAARSDNSGIAYAVSGDKMVYVTTTRGVTWSNAM